MIPRRFSSLMYFWLMSTFWIILLKKIPSRGLWNFSKSLKTRKKRLFCTFENISKYLKTQKKTSFLSFFVNDQILWKRDLNIVFAAPTQNLWKSIFNFIWCLFLQKLWQISKKAHQQNSFIFRFYIFTSNFLQFYLLGI